MIVGCIVWFSYFLSNKLTEGKFHGSAIAILLGLLFAYLGGTYTGGKQGVADISLLSGVGLLGGAMLRDFAIVATAYGVKLEDLKASGIAGVSSLVIGNNSSCRTLVSFCLSTTTYANQSAFGDVR